MVWQNPKTDWTPADGVSNADLNRIEGNTKALNERIDSYAVNKIAVYGGNNAIDPNTTQEAYILTNHSNCPPGDTYWHIHTHFYNGTTGNRAQVAQGYSQNKMFIRRYFSNSWSGWLQIEDVVGAQNKANAAQEAAINYSKGYGVGTTARNVSNQSWNNQTVSGFYRGNNMTNRPPYAPGAHAWDYGIVIAHGGGYTLQIVTEYNNRETWQRACINGTWGAWKKMADKSDIDNIPKTPYEEGTWTPRITSDIAPQGIVMTRQYGHYTRIGRMVHIVCDVGISNKGTEKQLGSLFITGLPFAAATENTKRCNIAVTQFSGVIFPDDTLSFFCRAGDVENTYLGLYRSRNNKNILRLQRTEILDDFDCKFSGIYYI